jgi:hypothetical protein
MRARWRRRAGGVKPKIRKKISLDSHLSVKGALTCRLAYPAKELTKNLQIAEFLFHDYWEPNKGYRVRRNRHVSPERQESLNNTGFWKTRESYGSERRNSGFAGALRTHIYFVSRGRR